MAEETERLWVRSCRDDNQVNFYERHPDHPDGVAIVAGTTPRLVAKTGAVAKALREPDGIREVSDAERAEWRAAKARRRDQAVEEAVSAGMAPAAEVAQLRNEMAELRAQIGRMAAGRAAAKSRAEKTEAEKTEADDEGATEPRG